MSKFTKGPWHATPYFVRPSKANGEIDNTTAIVKICRETRKAKIEEQRANAALIASAPDLLTALQDLLATIPFQDETNFKEVQKAVDAIAKATGGAE